MITEVFIKNLRVRANIGITEEERSSKQPLIINVILTIKNFDTKDDIKNTVDYFSLQKEICEMVDISKMNLLETLANDVANVCLKNDLAEKVMVSIEKPHIFAHTDSVGCSLIKYKNE